VKKPKIPLTDWQKAFIGDDAQFRFGAMARQSGKSFAIGADSVLGSVERPRALQVILSRGERQSLEVMQKVKMLCQAMGVAVDDPVDTFFHDTQLHQHTITFPNESRIIALPANADTARGYTGNIYLDEFGVHRDSREIWAAAAPIATRGCRITVMSTFKGTENRFYEIGKDLGLHEGVRPERQPVRRVGWSGHWVDIHMAAEQNRKALGLKIDVDGLRAALGDEEVWLQEYCNIPMSDASDYIATDLVLACEDDEVASLQWDEGPRPGLCAGWDFARKRDRSVIFIGEELGGLVVVRGVIYLDRMTFDQQEKKGREIAQVIQGCDGTFCMDAGGNGAQIAETLQGEFTCVDAVQFGSSVETGAKDERGEKVKELRKAALARDAKRRFEERTFRLPESVAIRRAVRSIKRSVSAAGNIIIDAARTEQGHGDEFWALALLNSACSGARGAVHVPASEVGLVGNTVMGGLMGRSF
jgi:phage FluMu gp28-like protein